MKVNMCWGTGRIPRMSCFSLSYENWAWRMPAKGQSEPGACVSWAPIESVAEAERGPGRFWLFLDSWGKKKYKCFNIDRILQKDGRLSSAELDGLFWNLPWWENGNNGFLVFKNIFIHLIYFWLHRVSVAALGIFPFSMWAFSSCGFPLLCVGFSCCGAWAQEHTAPVVAVCRLSCPVAYGILVPWPRMEPVLPALESKFLTIGPLGKS